MPQHFDPNSCDGAPNGNERRLADMGYQKTERVLLTIARLYFLTFSDPASQAWMRVGALSRSCFGEPRGAAISEAMLISVNELRLARGSAFEFANPDCPGCSQILCETERQFMAALTALRLGQISAAHANALLLCEGGDSAPLLSALSALGHLVDSPAPTPEPEAQTG